ncbi:uncharacterized protein LAESUDRAFT_718821 [Laetiporus sulphureus 93-53]|uniref:Uncharacterized protein n=1 Tax=Laetiporus sulphureus 93-53 TaxID=1314785 RepID=A0A165I3M6_9APHY|nr:uncharacterized protein LAESUDRAFT_718821 [Laetiporus sulphureus 93-53]KZT12552.1 hypothetical protein LAESUDRAFT_718821 [Laetiporus sulphureus 93-53]
MQSSPDTTTNSTDTDGTPPKPSIHLTIPPRLFILPGSALLLGAMIGLRRGARTAALQFLAENVHRPPTTVRGWYFYNKTKNYRVLMAGMKESGKEAARLGATAGVWVALEEGCERVDGLAKEAQEVIAAMGTASVFSVVCKFSVSHLSKAWAWARGWVSMLTSVALVAAIDSDYPFFKFAPAISRFHIPYLVPRLLDARLYV